MYTDQLKHQIINAYQHHDKSIAALCREHGISEPTITKWLKLAGLDIRRSNYQSLNLDIAEINRLYHAEGMSTYEIAAHLGCSVSPIRKRISNIKPETARNRRSKESINKIKESCTKKWKDTVYIAKVKAGTSTEQCKQKLREAGRRNAFYITRYVQSPEGRAEISARSKACWQRPEFRDRAMAFLATHLPHLAAASKEALNDPVKRAKWLEKLSVASTIRQATHGFISQAQRQLYYLLRTAGIDFIEESLKSIVGFYVVDCIISKQHNMVRDLIVEIDGEYWHSLPHIITRDKQKNTYISTHTDFDLLRLSELEMASPEAIESALGRYGIIIPTIKCTTKQLEISTTNERILQDFYASFHYARRIRAGAISFAALLDSTIIAAISYSIPVRHNIAGSIGYANHELLEISRIARMYNAYCPNLISFLIGRTRAMLPDRIKAILTYSDSTYGHNGTVYKAAGFTNLGETGEDYHYISIAGRYHKRTIWDRAKQMKMTEAEYANKHNIVKVETGRKTRWLYKLR